MEKIITPDNKPDNKPNLLAAKRIRMFQERVNKWVELRKKLHKPLPSDKGDKQETQPEAKPKTQD